MIDTVVVAPGESDSFLSGVSWPAIVAGAVVACALTLVLLAFGTGLGLTVVSPWAGSGVGNDVQNRHGAVFDRYSHDRFLSRRLPRRSPSLRLA